MTNTVYVKINVTQRCKKRESNLSVEDIDSSTNQIILDHFDFISLSFIRMPLR
jgi:hypothetical protein